MSLLLRRPAGREAYQVTYSISTPVSWKELQNSAMSWAAGHDSPAHCLKPGGRRIAHIPTNVISITDGQIYLESDLFLPDSVRR